MSAFDYDMITRFLEGGMKTDERRSFELSMEQDADLKKEVELCREMRETLQKELYPDAGEQAFRATLQQVRAEHFRTANPSGTPLPSGARQPGKFVLISRSIRWWAPASVAAAAILILVIWQPWTPDLYSRFAETSMPPVAERGGTEDSLLAAATTKFNAREFAASIPDFRQLLSLDSSNSYAQFYYSIALLRTDSLDKSRGILMRLNSGGSLVKYDAAFYLALSYLKERDTARAIHWLQTIPADASSYPRAKELLQKLQ
jgi:hypothetical protein